MNCICHQLLSSAYNCRKKGRTNYSPPFYIIGPILIVPRLLQSRAYNLGPINKRGCLLLASAFTKVLTRTTSGSWMLMTFPLVSCNDAMMADVERHSRTQQIPG